MIVSEPRTICFVSKGLQVGEPPQFASAESQPVGQVAHRLDGRNIPSLAGRNWLHPLRLGEPIAN
jgi:hypothetical protein